MKDRKLTVPVVVVILFFGYMIYLGIMNYGNRRHQEGIDLGASLLYGQVNEDLRRQLDLNYNVEQRIFDKLETIWEVEK